MSSTPHGPENDGSRDLARALRDAREEIARLAGEREGQRIRIAEFEERVEFGRLRLAALHAERDTIAARSDAVRAQLEAAEDEVRLTEAEVRARQRELQHVQRDQELLAARIGQLTTERARDHSEAEKRERRLEALQAESRSLADERESARLELERLRGEFHTSRVKAAAELDLLRGQLETQRADLDARRDELEALQAESRSLADERESACLELERLRGEFHTSRVKAAAELDLLRGQLETQRADLDARRDELEALQAEHAVQLHRREEVDRQLERSEAEREEREIQLAERDAQAKAAQAELERLVVDAAELRAKLTAESAALADAGESNADLTARLDDLDSALGESRGEAGRLRAEIDGLRRHADDLRATLAGAQEEIADAHAELGRLVAEHRQLARHLAQAQRALSERTDQLEATLGSRAARVARVGRAAAQRPVAALALVAGAAVLVVAMAFAAGWLGACAGLLVILATAALGVRRTIRRAAPVLLPRLESPLPKVEALVTLPVRRQGAPVASAAPARGASPAASVPATVVTRLVPAPIAGQAVEFERTRWLAGARLDGLKGLRVAAVLDEMSRACFAPECHLMTGFGLGDWQEAMEAEPPHMLLVESAWSGNNGGWQYGVAWYPHPRYQGLQQLRALVDWCRERGIPTVFWNKEDPVHFERFKEAAVLFDFVFTTDENCIGAYEALGSRHVKSVAALPFAAQPLLHNPIAGAQPRNVEPVFAGTYYRTRHVDRQTSLEMLLDAARPFGLKIYDRTHGTKSAEFGFPERFEPHIRGRLAYDEVIDAYKTHRLFLNVNSVADSPTMFSRRVFELLACGTAVISTESTGIERLFGDLVPIVRTPQEATTAIERVLTDDRHFSDVSVRGRRLVLGEHTYRDRLATVVAAAGFEIAKSVDQEIAAVALADDASDLAAIVDTLLRQTLSPDEVLVGVAENVAAEAVLQPLRTALGEGRVRTVTQVEGDPSDRYRELARLAAAGWVSVIGSEGLYGPDHLRDTLVCAGFTNADAVGSPVDSGPAHRYTTELSPLSALVRRETVAVHGWPGPADNSQRWFERGLRFYAGEPGNFTGPGEPTTRDRAARHRT